MIKHSNLSTSFNLTFEKQNDSEVKKKADADKYKIEAMAKAEAERVRMDGPAKADAQRAQGTTETEIIAEAEAKQKIAEAF